jgi:DNA-binding response OmpR family regulator
MKPVFPSILLIEKDELTLEIYQRELSNCFTVFTFTEINGVLETLAAQDICTVIIEPEIGAGKGWELIETIQKTFPGRVLPVIVCSTQDVPRKNMRSSVALYLTKPVLPRTLREKVLEVLKSE